MRFPYLRRNKGHLTCVSDSNLIVKSNNAENLQTDGLNVEDSLSESGMIVKKKPRRVSVCRPAKRELALTGVFDPLLATLGNFTFPVL